MTLQNLKTSSKLLALIFVTFAMVCSIIYLSSATNRVERSQSQPDVRELEQLRQLAASDDPQLAEVLEHNIVQIAAGDFVMGSDSGRDDERPQHVVYLDAFEIDRYEITDIQYQRFLQTTGRQAPPYWTADTYPRGQADYPVVGVSWDDADAYCTWTGKRLPTEAEWEKACRGTEAPTYPWGDTWDPLKANVDLSIRTVRATGHTEFEVSVWDVAWQLLQTSPTISGQPGLRPVGSYPEGASPYGVMDMVGNASEWVADWYNWSDYSKVPTRNPRISGPPWNHSLRGSPWHDPVGTAEWVQTMSRCSARNSAHATLDPRVGFRCARSIAR